MRVWGGLWVKVVGARNPRGPAALWRPSSLLRRLPSRPEHGSAAHVQRAPPPRRARLDPSQRTQAPTDCVASRTHCAQPLFTCVLFRRRAPHTNIVCAYAQHRARSPRDAERAPCARAPPQPLSHASSSRDSICNGSSRRRVNLLSGAVTSLGGIIMSYHAVFSTTPSPARTASNRCAPPRTSNRSPVPLACGTSPRGTAALLDARAGAPARPPHGRAPTD